MNAINTSPNVIGAGNRRSVDRTQMRLLLASSNVGRGAYFLLAIVLILTFTYLFAHPILEGAIKGNDSPYALSIINWIDRWFPAIPDWYPVQGAGSSSIVQYSYGSHYIAVIIRRITDLPIGQVFRLMQFSSIALTAVGVYLIVWTKLRNQTMALIAGLAYPISAAVWPWVIGGGLFGQSFSIIFFAPTFILFDAYLSAGRGIVNGDVRGLKRLLFPSAVILFSIMFIVHGATGFIFALTIIIYAFLMPLSENLKLRSLKESLRSAAKAAIGIAVGVGIIGFWLLPWLRLGGLTNREGNSGELALHQIPFTDLLAMIGLKEPAAASSMFNMSFASTVVILAAIGIVLSIRHRRIVVVWGIIAFVFALFTAMPGLWPEFVGVFLKVWANIYVRALIPTMIFLPAIAGYAVYRLAELPFNAVGALSRKMKVPQFSSGFAKRSVTILAASMKIALAVVIAFLSFVYLRRPPPGYGEYPGYGAVSATGYWGFEYDGATLKWSNPPSFEISSNETVANGETAAYLVSELGLESDSRLDISPYLGGVLETFPLYTDASTVNMYFYLGSLFHTFWGYQQGIFYGDLEGGTHQMIELASWLGLEHVIINARYDPTVKYDEANWAKVISFDDDSQIQVREIPNAMGIVSVIQRPSVLVIGGYENGSYEQVFKAALGGMLDYGDALIIEGKNRVDDYSAEQLQEFDAVFLYGYSYKDREKSWTMLDQYVSGGGSLFVETGWQFTSPDWEMGTTPPSLPISYLGWTDLGMTDQFVNGSLLIGGDWDTSQFAPLVWNGVPWGVSTTTKGGIREWAQPILAVNDKPLLAAGKYGQGRIVWSGMNLIAHASTYANIEEAELLAAAMDWLLENREETSEAAVDFSRNHPDNVEIRIPGPIVSPTYVLWREGHSPDWKASAFVDGSSTEVQIHRAGPGMMLLSIPPSNASELVIEMQYGFGILGWAGKLISIVSIAGLIGLPVIVSIRRGDRNPDQQTNPTLGAEPMTDSKAPSPESYWTDSLREPAVHIHERSSET